MANWLRQTTFVLHRLKCPTRERKSQKWKQRPKQGLRAVNLEMGDIICYVWSTANSIMLIISSKISNADSQMERKKNVDYCNKQCLSRDLIWSKIFRFGDRNLKLTLNYSDVFHARYTHYPNSEQAEIFDYWIIGNKMDRVCCVQRCTQVGKVTLRETSMGFQIYI